MLQLAGNLRYGQEFLLLLLFCNQCEKGCQLSTWIRCIQVGSLCVCVRYLQSSFIRTTGAQITQQSTIVRIVTINEKNKNKNSIDTDRLQVKQITLRTHNYHICICPCPCPCPCVCICQCIYCIYEAHVSMLNYCGYYVSN